MAKKTKKENKNPKINLEVAEEIIFAKDEIIAALETRLDGAYKEQEQMLKELKRWTDAFPYAFEQLEEHAGEITSEDVIYHVNLVNRIMKHKFEFKPKSFE